jgi:alanine racemase
MPRHALIDVDLDAVAVNAAAMVASAGGAQLCAVVKADGYGHGSIDVARAAIAGGATWLAVALVEEGQVLRDAGIEVPVLVLSEPPPDVMAEALEAGLTPTLYTEAGVRSAAGAVAGRPGVAPWPVHLKIDTGMHRVGAHPADALQVARAIVDAPGLALGGTFTHLAVADEPERPETDEQLDRFSRVLDDLVAAGIDPGLRHAANSAGSLAHPRAHLDMVRVGIALYGIAPAPALAAAVDLRPAMSLHAEVTLVKHLSAGDGVSYGLRHVFDRPATVAIVPLGYADGVPRRMGLTGGEVLIGGVRRPIRGVVTMDQTIVEVTGGPDVAPGDPVVLLGEQGGERITAQEWADRLDTIPYEVVCGFSVRLPRRVRPLGGAVATGATWTA